MTSWAERLARPATRNPLGWHYDAHSFRVTEKGAAMLHVAVVDHDLKTPDELERALARSKRLAKVARAVIAMLVAGGPCEDAEDPDGGGECERPADCHYCMLNRGALLAQMSANNHTIEQTLRRLCPDHHRAVTSTAAELKQAAKNRTRKRDNGDPIN